MAETHHIYLIPGLFGFSEIGGIAYFQHVRELLQDWFDAADTGDFHLIFLQDRTADNYQKKSSITA